MSKKSFLNVITQFGLLNHWLRRSNCHFEFNQPTNQIFYYPLKQTWRLNMTFMLVSMWEKLKDSWFPAKIIGPLVIMLQQRAGRRVAFLILTKLWWGCLLCFSSKSYLSFVILTSNGFAPFVLQYKKIEFQDKELGNSSPSSPPFKYASWNSGDWQPFLPPFAFFKNLGCKTQGLPYVSITCPISNWIYLWPLR